MRNLVNIESSANLEAVIAALRAEFGAENVEQPHPRTPRIVIVEAPVERMSDISSICAGAAVFDADTPVTPGLVTAQDVGHWHIGAISGLPLDQYGRDTGQFYLIDSLPNDGLVPGVEWLYAPEATPGNHGTGTADIARRVHDAPILACQGFDGNDQGTLADALAAMSAACDHREDNGGALDAVMSCSFSVLSPANPLGVVMERADALGIIIVASAGNDGADRVAVPRWPANAATYVVGAMDTTWRRWDDSAYPADLYAGGVGCDFLKADGTSYLAADGTSIATPVVAMCIRRALDEGMSVAELIGHAEPDVTNVPAGSSLRLLYPTVELIESSEPGDPPPHNLGENAMQLMHIGAAQIVANEITADLPWETSNGVLETEIVIPAGWSVARASALTMSTTLGTNSAYLYVVGPNGVVPGGRASFSGPGGNTEVYMPIHTLPFAVAEGEAYKVQIWHNGGTGTRFQERGDAQLGFGLEKVE